MTVLNSHRWRTAAEWLGPTVIAVLLLGPALRPGALFNLDLILTPRLDTPLGFWGLGPELPRRLPLWLPISWLSVLIPATVVGKVLLVALFVVPWVGMARLTKRIATTASPYVCHVAGALYALSPFILTRAAVGHFNVTMPHAVLPWVLPVLLRPGRRLGATFVACFAMGFAGHFGGSVALTVILVAVLCGRHERWLSAFLVGLCAQAPWLVPGVLVSLTNHIEMASGSAFPTDAAGLSGLARLSAGGGFWNTYFQIGGSGLAVTAVGLALLTFGVIGTRRVDDETRVPLVVLGALGWFVAAASAIRGVSTVFLWVDDHLLAGIWREGHRMLTLHLLWLAPTAALGGQRLYEACRRRRDLAAWSGPALVLPLAITVMLAVPGVWGLGGQLSSTPLPHSWQQTRDAIDTEPGTVLALPWFQYFNLSIDGGPVRRVLNPLSLYLGGDVLASSDNGLQQGVRETGDAREVSATALIKTLVSGKSIGPELGDLGVRWIVMLKTVHQQRYAALDTDAGLRRVIDADDIALYEVMSWHGAAVDSDGATVATRTLGPGFAWVDSPQAVQLSRAGSGGWMRGVQFASTTPEGLLSLPTGGGLVWNLATIPALLSQLLPGIAVAILVARRWRRGRRRRAECVGVALPVET